MMEHRRAVDARAASLMVLLCLCWSLQQVSLKAAAIDIAPLMMIAMRSGVALVVIAALMLTRGETLLGPKPHWVPGLAAGALFALEYALVAESIRHTYTSHVVVILYTGPIFAALGLHWRLPEERMNLVQWLGVGCAFAGVALTFAGRSDGPHAGLASALLWGDALALLGGMAWGATTVVARSTALRSASPAETILYQVLCALVLLWPLAVLTGQDHFDPTPTAWAHLAFQGVVVSCASLIVWFWLLRRYLASRLGVFAFMTPLFGVAFGIVLLDEPLEASFIGGSALVLTGIALVSGHAWVTSYWMRSPAGTHRPPRA